MSIAENIKHLHSSLPTHVTLVAVSKTKPMEMVLEAYQAGQRHFGENYVQELTEKAEHLPKDIKWHFIGHLQSNKVKQVIPYTYLIHGVDSLKLLNEINKQAVKLGKTVNCLLQVYIATEESKFGLDKEELTTIINQYNKHQLPNIRLCGFMGMASNTSEQKQLETEFNFLHTLFQTLKPQLTVFPEQFAQLSMGMSGDYPLAIQHGSTMVRIGSSIFGVRQYTNE